MSILDQIEALACSVKSEWKKSNFEVSHFSPVATKYLKEFISNNNLAYIDVIKWLVNASQIGKQSSLGASFGQPPITVYYDENFRIELLLWHVGVAAVHHHVFSGAFAMVHGECLHSIYEFIENEKLCNQLRIGEINIKYVELLQVGDIREIIPGPSLIHSTFHLDMPSVTMVVRTHIIEEFKPELEYRVPYIAFDSCYVDPLIVKKIQVLDFLAKIRSTEYQEMLFACLDSTDIFGCYLILRQLYLQHEQADKIENTIKYAINIYGSRISYIISSIKEEKRRLSIYRLRNRVTDPGQRYYLALLLYLPTIDSIIKHISIKFPNHDTLALIYKWSTDLICESTDTNSQELFLILLKSIIEKKHFSEFILDFSKNNKYNRLEIEEYYHSIKSSEILKPLFYEYKI